MSRKATAKTFLDPKKVKTNANQVREWTTLDYQHECGAAVQSICDASVDEDYQYHGSIPQNLEFREDAQTRMQSSQPHHPYNSRLLSSDENAVIGGTHQPTRFVMEEAQMQQQNELLNTRVQEVPMIGVLQEKPGIRKEEKSKTINWLGEEPRMQQVPQEDIVFARPPSRQQLVPETLKKKATEQLSSSARLVNSSDKNLNAITAGSPDLKSSSKTYYDQVQSSQFYQPDSHADKLEKEKEFGDYIDRVIAVETSKLQNELAEKKGRGRPKGRRNKSVSKISIAHQHEINQEDSGYIKKSNSIIQQQHPALCRALGKPRKLRQLSDRANVPYLVIAGLALHNAKIPLISKEVYRFARYYFPRCVISASWKNSLRCSLSTNNVFKQDGVTEGNAYLWSIANSSELWDAINTFVAGNRDPNTYGMTDPSLWGKLLEGTMGVLDKAIKVNLDNVDIPPRAPKKRASQREGDMTPQKQRCYSRQQSTPLEFNFISQNYQHIPHFVHPYYQMASNGYDEYGYQQMTNEHHFHPDGVYPPPQNMHLPAPYPYYNQHMQMPTHANNQHPPTVFPGYPLPDPSHPSPFPSLFAPHPPGQMPFPPMTSFHEAPASPESQEGLQSHLYVGNAEDSQNGGEH